MARVVKPVSVECALFNLVRIISFSFFCILDSKCHETSPDPTDSITFGKFHKGMLILLVIVPIFKQ